MKAMLNKHFFKTLFGFIALLLMGLGVLFALNEFDKSNGSDRIETQAVDGGQQ